MLQKRLRWIARRLRYQAAIDRALEGSLAGLAVALLVIGLSRFLPIPFAIPLAAISVAGGFVAGAFIGGFRRVTLLTAAIAADRAAGTQEVITTALECDGCAFSPTLLSKAESLVASLPAKSFVPRYKVRTPWINLILALLVTGVAFVPPLSYARADANEIAAIAPSILNALERSGRDIKRVGDQTGNRDLASLGKEMERLAAAAQRGDISKKEALAKIAALTEKAEQAKAEMESKKSALDKLQKSPETKGLADAIARNDQHDAKSQADKIAEKMQSMDDAEKKSLKETLEKIANESKGELGEAAREAAEALAKGDSGQLGQKMEKLAGKMKGAGGKQGSDGEQQAGKQGAQGEQELKDAMDDLSEAEEDLKGQKDKLARESEKFCDDCGKKKEGG